jgi:hypothetical protein
MLASAPEKKFSLFGEGGFLSQGQRDQPPFHHVGLGLAVNMHKRGFSVKGPRKESSTRVPIPSTTLQPSDLVPWCLCSPKKDLEVNFTIGFHWVIALVTNHPNVNNVGGILLHRPNPEPVARTKMPKPLSGLRQQVTWNLE